MNYQPSLVPQPLPANLVDSVLASLHANLAPVNVGALADYIPELAKANPAHFGIVIATTDGAVYAVGDSDIPFTIQSISKAFVFGQALDDHGRDHVLRKVGVEPSGEAFNSIVFDTRANRPFNPMVNAGAIATSGLVKGADPATRLARVQAMFQRYVGHPVELDEAVFRSEKLTGHRNRAIAHLELNFGMLAEPIEEHLDLYFQQCSLLVTARDLACMAATLANGGINPFTGQAALKPEHVKHVIAVMNSCGMYDYSGEWSYRVGLPAKSGVGGGIIAVLPGAMGIGVFSPPLDERGNSVRGIKVCETLSEQFGLNMFDATRGYASAIRRQYDAGSTASKRTRSEPQRGLLEQVGRRAVVLELRGVLGFAAVEQISRRIAACAAAVSHLILDLLRADQVEPQAAHLLGQLLAAQEAAGRRMRLVVLPGSACQRQLAAALPVTNLLPDLDQALEWAEDALLAAMDAAKPPELERDLTEMDLLQKMPADALAELAASVQRREYPAGTLVLRQGEQASEMFFLARGRVSVRLPLAGGQSRRLATLEPGVAFGEMALLDGAPRSADVLADTDIVAYALSLQRLEALSEGTRAVKSGLLAAIGRQLSQRLRRANQEINAQGG